ncbi:MAG: hypothetical protein HQK54_14005, partial [Oligoflexales bacterium]|nr:hypothetical protein [Oligoflexales bacterium]
DEASDGERRKMVHDLKDSIRTLKLAMKQFQSLLGPGDPMSNQKIQQIEKSIATIEMIKRDCLDQLFE